MALRAGEWELGRPLGSGGMAEVFEAKSASGETAAVKLLRRELTSDAEVLARFWREARLASQIGHPGIVRVFGHGYAEDGRPYIAMELLEGRTLNELRRAPGGLPLPKLLDLVDQLLDVLNAAHTAGVVHRDLKPANLLVTPEGRLEVLDFGIARVLEASADELRTATGVAIGTVTYMAPEQAAGLRDQIDARTDLFSVGAIMFRVLSGRRVHESTGQAQALLLMASTPAPSLASVAPGVPAPIVALVDRALAFDKAWRFSSAREMQLALRAAREPAAATLVSAGHVPEPTLATRVSAEQAREPTAATVALGAPSGGLPAPIAAPPEARAARSQSSRAVGLVALLVIVGALIAMVAFVGLPFGLGMWALRSDSTPTSTSEPFHCDTFKKMTMEQIRASEAKNQFDLVNHCIETSGVVHSISQSSGIQDVMVGSKPPRLDCWSEKDLGATEGSRITVRGRIGFYSSESGSITLAACEIVK